MPDNTDIVLQVFAKIDNGFARVHEKMDAMKDELSGLKQNHTEVRAKLDHLPTQPCDGLVSHLQRHPDKTKMQELIDASEDNRTRWRDVAWGVIKAIAVILVLGWLGLKEFG